VGWNTGVVTQPFNAAELDPQLSGHDDWFIDGGNGVTSVVDNMVSIYNNLPQTALTYHGLPADKVLAHNIDLSNDNDWNAYQAATDGIWITTVDPTTRGLDASTDFSTLFIGDVPSAPSNLVGSPSQFDMANMDKADQAFIASQNHSTSLIRVSNANPAAGANQYSVFLANVASQELGFLIGLDVQPTDYVNYMLIPDDPDNNPNTVDDSNLGVALMAYSDNAVYISSLRELGTANLEPTEFPIGNIDTLDLVLNWLT